MKTFTLTISPDYVKDWTAQDGIREFIQNALDQETMDKDNTATIKVADGLILIENNNSVLPHSTLLLGGGTKSDNNDTIGGFGEGYKIALLVLIRLGFKVSILNYGLDELWEPEISYCADFNTDVLKVVCKPLLHGRDIERGVSVIISKSQFNFHNILSEVSLTNRPHTVVSQHSNYGQVLASDTEKGRIYIGGLYITTDKDLFYGYNFNPGILSIGRDRNITNTFDIAWYAGYYMFINLLPEYLPEFMTNITNKITDLNYLQTYSIPESAKTQIKADYLDKQVISNESDKQTLTDNGIKLNSPVVVPSIIKDIVWNEGFTGSTKIVRKSVKDLLGEFLESEKSSLSDDHYDKLKAVFNRT